MWQADHTPLDVVLLDEAGKPARPWLTAIEDDYSRAIASFRLTFQEPTALTTALALRQAIWRKEDSHWHICGIPTVFYSDHGSDFTSKHMEQVAVDLGIELIFSEKGVPRGRGKIERFFRSVNELFLQNIPGYAPKGYQAEAQLELSAFEQQLVKAHSDDFTDQEAVAAILRITRGNMRLIERLMMQVEHILVANQLQVVTKEVVETARENLIIGLN
jgi:transposase InsO family protein